MDHPVFDAMPQKLVLQPTAVEVHAYGNPDPLTMSGVFSAHFVLKDRSVTSPMYMEANGTDVLISYVTATA